MENAKELPPIGAEVDLPEPALPAGLLPETGGAAQALPDGVLPFEAPASVPQPMPSHETIPPGAPLPRRALADQPRHVPAIPEPGSDVQVLGEYLAWKDRTSDATPQQAAEVGRIVAASGMAPEYVWENLAELRDAFRDSQVDWVALARAHPTLADFLLSDPTRFEMARDDVANLSGLEYWLTGRFDQSPETLDEEILRLEGRGAEVARARGTPPVWAAVLRDAVKEQALIARQTVQALTTEREAPDLGAFPNPETSDLWRSIEAEQAPASPAVAPQQEPAWRIKNQERIDELARQAPGAKDYGRQARSIVGKVFLAPFKFAPVIAGNVAAATAGTLVGGPAGTVGGMIAFNTYENFGPLATQLLELRGEDGKPIEPGIALAAAGAASVAGGTVMAVGLGPIVRNLPGVAQVIERATLETAARALVAPGARLLLGRAAAHFGADVATGAAAIALQAGINRETRDLVQKHADPTFQPEPGGVAGEMWSTFWNTIPELLVLAGTSAGSRYMRDLGRVRAAAESEATITGALRAAQQSKLLERAPAEFAELVRRMDAGGDATVYVDAQRWASYCGEKGLDPRETAARFIGDAGRAYDEASATRGAVRFPLSVFLGEFAKEGHAEKLLDDVRLSPDGLTPRQAREERERLAARAAELAVIQRDQQRAKGAPSDADAERAQALRDAEPPGLPSALFDGLTDPERQEYDRASAEAMKSADLELLRRITENKGRENEAWWKAEEAKFRGEVEAVLDQDQVQRTLHFLRTGELRGVPPGSAAELVMGAKPLKLDRDAVREIGGGPWLVDQLPRDIFAARKEDAAHPADVAALFEFASADDMLYELRRAEPREAIISREVKARMAERYGPALLDSPEALAAAALDAARTEAAAKRALLELRALARRLDPEAPARAALWTPEALKGKAMVIIRQKPLGQVSPAYYLAAEQTAGRRAFEAASAGHLDLARVEKEAQALNLFLYREARDVRAELDSAFATLVQSAKEPWRTALGKASPAYRDAHDELLLALGLHPPGVDPAAPRLSFDEMLTTAAGDAMTIGFDVEGIRALLQTPRPWKQLTVDEARNVMDAVTNIRRAANLRNEVLVSGRRFEKNEILGRMAETAGDALPLVPRRPWDASVEGVLGTVRHGYHGIRAALLGPETMAEMLSGAKRDSVFHEVFIDSMLAARNRENELARKYGAALVEAWAKMPDEIRARRFELLDLSRDLPVREDLAAAANLDTRQASRTLLWMVFLNRGNRENLQRLLDGYGWTLEQVDAALEKHLTKPEAVFLQRIWDSLEGMYPEIAALHERDTGLPLGKVQPAPFKLRLGGEDVDFAGGYFPAKYDPRPGMSERGFAAQEASIAAILDPQSRYPGTPKSHTKRRALRVEDVIDLRWSVVPEHVSQVIHDLAWREWVRQTAAIVVDPRFEQIVANRLGPEYAQQFRPWLQSIASDRADAVTSDVRSVLNLMMLGRSRVMTAAVGHRLATALGDLSNPILAVLGGYVRPDYMARATKRLTPTPGGSWREAWSFVYESSPEIRHRRERSLQHLRMQFDAIGTPGILERNPRTARLGELLRGAQETAFVTLETSDKITSTQVWLGKYLQERAAAERAGTENPHAAAVREADATIRKLFPAEWAGEKAAILRKKWLAPLLMFYGYFSKVYNLRAMARFEAWRTLKDTEATSGQKVGAVSKAAGQLLGISIALSLGELFSGRGREDSEDWAAWWARRLAGAQVVDLPLIGPFLEPLATKVVRGDASRVSMRAAPGLAMGQELLDRVQRVVDDPEADEQALLDAADVAALVLGVPTKQIRATAGYATSETAKDDWRHEKVWNLLGGLIYGDRMERAATDPLTELQQQVDGAP